MHRPITFRRTFSTRAILMLALLAGCAQTGTGSRVEERVPAAGIRDAETVAPRADYREVAAALESFIAREMAEKRLPALSIALVEAQEIVWARGFGFASPEDSVRATARTIYRVGSVSKLFTDLAVMRLVERGALALDAPITRYVPELRVVSPSGKQITLRQLMAHRAGLVREPPVGNYFDPSEPSLEATVRSLQTTRLVYEPGTRIKYSNAGIALVGYALERTQGQPFARYLEREVLRPLGLGSSSFEPTPEIAGRLATAYMWTYDGRTFPAPTFQLGMVPAGSMYSTVTDLGRFLSALFAIHGGDRNGIVRPETLREMWTPQFAAAGQRSGFGIGFALSELDGRPRIGHGGAIYGFATELAGLPDQQLGVVVATTMDIANSVTTRIADGALRLMTAAREGRPLPALRSTTPLPTGLADRLEGRFRRGEVGVELVERRDSLYLTRDRGGYRVAVRSLRTGEGDTLIADDRLDYGLRVVPLGDDRIVVGRDTLERVAAPKPAPAPDRWRGLIGEYGWDHNTLYILEKDGRLQALIEWFFRYPLEEIASDTFAFPDWGLYDGERLVFTRDASGRATQVEAASVVFARRPVGTEDGVTFRIEMVRPVEELRREALAATPPRETGNFRASDLVEVTKLDSTIKLDMRYATTNNFMSTVFYSEARAFMQRPAAEAVVRAHRSLRPHGYGLLIYDAYRPWYVTKMFWDATPEAMKIFVANPAAGSRHNRGAAVDLTLYDLRTGQPVQTVSGYDEFSPRAFPEYPGGTSLQRWHRDLLRDAMEAQGFEVYEHEWWHFDFGEWRRYPIGTATFDQIR